MKTRLFVAGTVFVFACAVPSVGESPRTIRFSYEVAIGPLDSESSPAHIFVPLAQSDDYQQVVSREVTASIPGIVGREEEHGNVYWHGQLADPRGEIVDVRVEYVVERRPYRKDGVAGARGDAVLSKADQERVAKYLDADRLVPVNHPMLAPALEGVRPRLD